MRAGREHDAVRRRPARARARERAVRVAHRLARRRPAELARTATASVAGGSARGLRLRVKTTSLAAAAAASRSIAGGVLVVEDRDDRDEPAARRVSSRQRLAERGACPSGLCAPSSDASAARVRRPRGGRERVTAAAAARDRSSSSARRGTPRAAARASAKLRRWKAPGAATSTPGSAGALDQRRAVRARRTSRGHRERVGVQVGADDERAAGRARRRASRARCRRIVGPSQRVCSSPTFVSTCTARRDARWSRRSGRRGPASTRRPRPPRAASSRRRRR